MDGQRFGRPDTGWRLRAYTVIFEADTRAGRLFDLLLMGMILASVGVVVLDSMAEVHARYSAVFNVLEWLFTTVFTVEYIARLACVRRPLRYAQSGFGIIDLLALLPTYLVVLVCLSEGHAPGARFCSDCGARLPRWQHDAAE
ncbi:hypothetical protein os1_24260 [Comamonadaceae bacterium OS-1]|nr:hypothetical protein os1_24260 [Comamonadaceae bacterium OS-1]